MDQQEYYEKFKKNQKITGFGLDVTMHMPCPSCCEPDFMVYKVLDSKKAMEEESICKHCGFGVKAIFKKTHPTDLEFELVQTKGGPLPDFLPPIRRAV